MHAHCLKCNGISFRYLGMGIQKVEKEIRKIFPKAKISRIDKDADIAGFNTDADIYIGTEYFIKNYLPDINNINLVAIISVDNLFFSPDFRSGEKAFSWIRKIISLSEEKKAIFLIQTFYPENSALKLALKNDYEIFFKQEIENRKILNYPPFGKFIKLIFGSKEEKETNIAALELKKELIEKFGNKIEVLDGENVEKSKQKFISKIILKTSTDFPKELLFCLNNLPQGWTIDIDPRNLL
jgi:primosomal protein N' (replication factor Y)